ncbi:MAG: RNA polymerase sigma factor, partial [Planctomycetota bacterium]
MQRDTLEFSVVYNEFYEKILRYMERMVGKDQAEDLTQEVFIKVNKGLEVFEGKSKLSTWIYRIATNTALDRLRSRSSRRDSQMAAIGDADNQSGPEGTAVSVVDRGLS